MVKTPNKNLVLDHFVAPQVEVMSFIGVYMYQYNSLTIYSWILIATSLLLVSLAHKTTQKRSHITSILFAWLMASEAIYSLGYAMELASIDIEQVKFWINIQFLGASFIPAFVILGSYSYVNHANAPFRIYFILLFLSFVVN